MGETCESCRFWRRDGVLYPDDGRCRRYPRMMQQVGHFVWPDSAADDWCGEHQPIEPKREASSINAELLAAAVQVHAYLGDQPADKRAYAAYLALDSAIDKAKEVANG